MNYVKNNKRRLIAFTKTSIILATVSPIIINSDSTEAMFINHLWRIQLHQKEKVCNLS